MYISSVISSHICLHTNRLIYNVYILLSFRIYFIRSSYFNIYFTSFLAFLHSARNSQCNVRIHISLRQWINAYKRTVRMHDVPSGTSSLYNCISIIQLGLCVLKSSMRDYTQFIVCINIGIGLSCVDFLFLVWRHVDLRHTWWHSNRLDNDSLCLYSCLLLLFFTLIYANVTINCCCWYECMPLHTCKCFATCLRFADCCCSNLAIRMYMLWDEHRASCGNSFTIANSALNHIFSIRQCYCVLIVHKVVSNYKTWLRCTRHTYTLKLMEHYITSDDVSDVRCVHSGTYV